MKKLRLHSSLVAGFALGAVALAAGCGAPRAGGAVPASGALPPDASFAGFGSRAVSLAITVDKHKPPAGVPAAGSIGLALGSAHPTMVRFAAKPPCKSSGPDSFTCTIKLSAAPGFHWLTVTAYGVTTKADAASPISTNRLGVELAGSGSSAKIALYAPSAKVSVKAQGPDITGDASSGFKLGGSYTPSSGPAPFSVDTVDAAGAHLVGPGSPTFTYTTTNKAFKLAVPDPNELAVTSPGTDVSTTIHATGHGSHPGSCSKCSLSFKVSASSGGVTPPPTSSPTPSSSSSPTSSPSPKTSPSSTPSSGPSSSPGPTPTPTAAPEVFVSYTTSGSTGTIRAFSTSGNLMSTSGWTNTGNPMTLSYASSNNLLYALTAGATVDVNAYGLGGALQTLSPGFGSVTATAFVYNPVNQLLYVANGTSVSTYNTSGTLQRSGIFSTTNATPPNGMTVNPNNGNLYVIDGTTIDEFNDSGTKQPTSGWTAGCASCTPTGIVYDPPGENWLYVTWSNTSSLASAVVCYESNGGACPRLMGSFSGVNLPVGIAYLPSNGNLYVANANSVSVYTFEGVAVSTSSFNPGFSTNSVNGIAVVP